MKIGLIISANIWFCPYLHIYTKILDKKHINYDIVSWDRTGLDGKHGIQFHSSLQRNRIEKLISFLLYVRFIKKVIRKENYDKLIIFGPKIGVFISGFLKRNFNKRYIFDYRDLSIEQKKIFNHRFVNVLKNSDVIFISSPGFKKYLPAGFDYVISHNFNIDKVVLSLQPHRSNTDTMVKDKIKVLTIGGIRDYVSNEEVIRALANNEKFELYFVGKGSESDNLKKYVEAHNINNVFFHGYYKKEEEADFIKKADIMNIYYPKVKTHDTALSNRFYNALIFNKPMLVTANSIQGDYVEKYNLGLSVDDCVGLDKKIIEYLSSEHIKHIQENSLHLLDLFVKDYHIFEKKVLDFLEK